MRDSSDPKYDIGKHKILEIGLPKSYSNRTFVCSFKGDPELWSRFKGECAARGVSICHVLEALMEAWIQGQKAEATLIRPVTVNLTMEHIVKRPRREGPCESAVFTAKHKPWPPPCEKADNFIKSTQEVGCLDLKEFLSLEKCWQCFCENSRR